MAIFAALALDLMGWRSDSHLYFWNWNQATAGSVEKQTKKLCELPFTA